jgi:hypothetical protein
VFERSSGEVRPPCNKTPPGPKKLRIETDNGFFSIFFFCRRLLWWIFRCFIFILWACKHQHKHKKQLRKRRRKKNEVGTGTMVPFFEIF